jgi:DNA-binding response OmpR family regulator
MLIDDNAEQNRALAMALGLRGIQADAFDDPVEAIESFRTGVYSLVLLDVQMPRMDGFHVYREIRGLDRDVPVCFLTAFDIHESEFRRVFPKMEIRGIVKKPVMVDELARQVTQMVASRAQQLRSV